MFVGEGYSVAHAQCLIVILLPIRLEKRNIAAHYLVGRVHIAEHLGPRRFARLPAAVDVNQGPFLFALVPIEDTQRNAHADADSFRAIGIIRRGVIRKPCGISRIGRAVRDRQFVVGVRLLKRLSLEKVPETPEQTLLLREIRDLLKTEPNKA